MPEPETTTTKKVANLGLPGWMIELADREAALSGSTRTDELKRWLLAYVRDKWPGEVPGTSAA